MMIEVSEAVKIINNARITFPEEEIPVEDAVGRILRQDVFADRDFPPFDRVMMDGIAVRKVDLDSGQKKFPILGVQAAGMPPMRLEPGKCLEVMTGAIIPHGADIVVPYEDVALDYDQTLAVVRTDYAWVNSNIHRKGNDKKAGELLIRKGKCISPAEVAIAATVGLSKIKVTQRPSIAIVSTGDELVGINQDPEPHQIRMSNAYAIAAELQKSGIRPSMHHLKDDKSSLQNELGKILEYHDILLLSGGVSRGKYDYVPEALDELGIEKKIHRIRQKPGKPMFFGVKENQKVVFAFPGNPVSTFLCFYKYFLPWLQSNLGQSAILTRKAVLTSDFSIKTDLAYFLQVKTHFDEEGRLLAAPLIGHGSGDHANLLESDGFLELPPDTRLFRKGQAFGFIPFRDL